MPHSTRASSQTRVQTFKFPAENKATLQTSMEKFPDHVESMDGTSPYTTSNPSLTNGYTASPVSDERWQPRRESHFKGASWANGPASTGGRHGRQKSLTEAIRTIRTRGRGASVSANVHEIGDALKAPVSPMLIVCNSSRKSNSMLMFAVDSLYYMVYVKRSHKYLLKIHPECVPKTSNTHPNTICFRCILLRRLLLAIDCISSPP